MRQLITFFFAALISLSISSQTPEAINYQGVARDASNNPLGNQNISLQISILESTANGTEIYKETHQTTTTDLGLFTLEIGNGTVSNGIFEDIEWGSNDHFVKVEIDANGGNNYELVSTSQLLSVPYALHAKHAENGTPWGENAGGIHYENGYVGIGTTMPQHPLHVVNIDGGSNQGLVLSHGTNGSGLTDRNTGLIIKKIGSNPIGYSRFSFTTQNSQGAQPLFGTIAVNYKNTTANNEQGELVFATRDGGNYGERLRISSIGNVGIGTDEPTTKLQIAEGDIYLDDVDSGVIMTSPNGQCWRMTVNNSGQPVINAITCP